MKRRITYITAPDAAFDPTKQVILNKSSLSIHGLDAAREERITFTSDELLTESFIASLPETRELHIRWTTERNYDSVSPFLARTSPGLHVYHDPMNDGGLGELTNSLCPLLKQMFESDIKCLSQEESFSEAPAMKQTRLSASPQQFYHMLPSIDRFAEYLRSQMCDQNDNHCLSALALADSIAIDYDAASKTTALSIFWCQPPAGASRWTEDITTNLGSTSTPQKVEVGLLSNEETTNPEDVKLGGFLAVVGQDSKLKPTLFSFPSRHHTLPPDATYTTAFETPTGLHPTLKLSLSPSSLARPPAPDDTTCSLHTYLTLPSTIFADKYQLSTKDRLFLNSHNLVGLRAVSGETDLEAPDWVIPRWGSNLLVEVATPSESQAIDSESSWDVTIPLHFRYLKPSESGFQPASLPWPIVFWACSAGDNTEMGKNPFDRIDLGYDALFPSKTFFFHLHAQTNNSEPASEALVEKVRIPVLQAATDGGMAYRVEMGTLVAISLGFLWIVWKLMSVFGFASRGPGDSLRTPQHKQHSTKKER